MLSHFHLDGELRFPGVTGLRKMMRKDDDDGEAESREKQANPVSPGTIATKLECVVVYVHVMSADAVQGAGTVESESNIITSPHICRLSNM